MKMSFVPWYTNQQDSREQNILPAGLIVLEFEGDIDMILGMGISDQTLDPPSLNLVDKAPSSFLVQSDDTHHWVRQRKMNLMT